MSKAADRLSNVGVKNLCAAVIENAVDQYREKVEEHMIHIKLLRKRNGQSTKAILYRNKYPNIYGELEYPKANLWMAPNVPLAKFFKSSWFEQLTEPVGGFQGTVIMSSIIYQEVKKAIELGRIHSWEKGRIIHDLRIGSHMKKSEFYTKMED